jgi:hypothetical protein
MMPKIASVRLSVNLIGLLIIASCSSDLDINSGHPAVPVIWCAMNPYDSVQYVRVQKTFIINTKKDWANLNPDSLQYLSVEVILNGKKGDSVIWSEHFTQTTTSRDSGFFPQGVYQVFKLDHPLPIKRTPPDRQTWGYPDTDSLVLEVRIHDIGLTAKATAFVLRPDRIINYLSRFTLYLYGSKPSLFKIPNGGEAGGGNPNASFNQIEFRVHYKEYYPNGYSTRSIYWKTYEGFVDNEYYLYPNRFFYPLKIRLPKSDTILARRLDSIDVAVLRPNKFFNHYWAVKDYWDGSERPPFYNFENAYGMFFTYIRDEWTGMQLNWQAMDSLCNGDFYKEMKFKK